MLDSHKFAAAAHMHVLLRRKTGRVTDTEWMVANAEYAREVVRLARAKAHEASDPELAQQADKLETVLLQAGPVRAETALDRLRARHQAGADPAAGPRYVGGIR